MADSWYYRIGETETGPIDSAQLQQLATRGEITAQSQVRAATSPNWVPAGRIRGLEFPSDAKVSTSRSSTRLKRAKPLDEGSAIGTGLGSTLGRSPPEPPPIPPPVSSGDSGRLAPQVLAPPADVQPLPVGVAVSSGSAIGVWEVPWRPVEPAPAAPPAPPVAEQPPPESERSRKKRAARRQMIWMISGSAGILLAILAVGIMIAVRGNRPTQAVAKQAGDESLADELEGQEASGPATLATDQEAVSEPEQADQVPARDTDQPAARRTAAAAVAEAAKSAAGGAAQRSSGEGPGEVEAALKSVARWFDLASATSISSRSMKLQITGIWFDQVAGDDQSVQRLFVELRLGNVQADTPLNYHSWNGGESGEGKSAALLLAKGDARCRLVPGSEAPHASRQLRPVRINPGQSVAELLIFDVAPDDDEPLRLLLPTSAIGQGSRYLGLRIPREMIADQKPVALPETEPAPEAASAASAKRKAAAAGDQVPVGGAASVPAASQPAGAAAPKPAADREESIDDLKKAIVDSVKQARDEKDKDQPQAPDPNPPRQKP